MKAALRTTFLLVILTHLSSCLEIYEKIILNKNGSGKAELVLDLSKLKSTLDLIGRMGAPGNREITSEDPVWSAKSDFVEKKELLDRLSGITECVIVEDTATSKIGFRFSFSNVQALNEAMNIISDIDSGSVSEDYYKFKKREFTRTETDDFEELNLSGATEDESVLNVIPLFEDMRYIMEYTMPKKVKSVSNKNATLSLDGKTVILSYDILKYQEGKTVANTIRY